MIKNQPINKNILAVLAVPLLLSACSYMPSWMGGKDDEKPKLAGERYLALPVESKIKPDDSLKNSAAKLPAVSTNADWAQNASKFNAATSNLAIGNLTNKTSASIGDGVKFSHPLAPQPVVSGGLVFAMDAAGNISAHDAADISKIRWQAGEIADTDGKDVIGGGLAVDGGVLYASTGVGAVGAFEASTGKLIWQKNFSTPMRAAPRASGDVVLVVTIDSQTYALSAKTGAVLWDHRGINETAEVMNSVSPTIIEGVALVPYSSGELFALSLSDGKEIWSETLLKSKNTEAYGVFSGIGGDPIVDSGVVFATSNNGGTAAISAGGQRIWQQQAGSLNSPWLSGDELFLLNTDNTLVNMVKYTGKIRWATQLENFENPEKKLRPIGWRGPVLAGGKLLVISSNGRAVFVDATNGKIASEFSVPNDTLTAPIIAGGKLYLVDKQAKLYSFE